MEIKMPASHFAKKYNVSMEKAKKINAAYMANKDVSAAVKLIRKRKILKEAARKARTRGHAFKYGVGQKKSPIVGKMYFEMANRQLKERGRLGRRLKKKQEQDMNDVIDVDGALERADLIGSRRLSKRLKQIAGGSRKTFKGAVRAERGKDLLRLQKAFREQRKMNKAIRELGGRRRKLGRKYKGLFNRGEGHFTRK